MSRWPAVWTGLGWATRFGGQALIRSHGPPEIVVGSTGQYEANTVWCVSRFLRSRSNSVQKVRTLLFDTVSNSARACSAASTVGAA